LSIEPDLFSRTWAAARSELAMQVGSSFMGLIDRYRRATLILESEYVPRSDAKASGTMIDAFRSNGFVARLQDALPSESSEEASPRKKGESLADLGTRIAILRHRASHFQRKVEVEDGRLEFQDAVFGVEPYNTELREEMFGLLPVVERMAQRIVHERVGGGLLRSFAQREPSLEELAELHDCDEYAHTADLRRNILERIIYLVSERAEPTSGRVTAIIQRALRERTKSSAGYVARAGLVASETTRAVLELVDRDDIVAAYAVSAITRYRRQDPDLFAQMNAALERLGSHSLEETRDQSVRETPDEE
jgi:hypothetical protein